MSLDQPLEQYRVLELSSGAGAFAGRVLNSLGAQVVKVEPANGDPMRTQGPLAGDLGIAFSSFNAGKSAASVDLESPDGQARIRDALANFDVLLDGNPPGWLRDHGLDPDELRDRHPHLVITSVTHFGQTGPYRNWHGSALVDFAISGSLVRMGPADMPPCSPPYLLPYTIAGITAATATTAALWDRSRTGRGDWIDCSVLESILAQSDWSAPLFSITGMSGKRMGAGGFGGWKTKDGWVKIANLSPKQFRGQVKWLDHPDLQGPEWQDPAFRRQNIAQLEAIQAEKLLNETTADLFRSGQALNVGIAPIYSPPQVMADEHFVARETFRPLTVGNGQAVRAPSSFARMNMALPPDPTPAPAPASDDTALEGTHAPITYRKSTGDLPLAGLRAIEVGSGAVGPEIARLIGELGADVIKVESMRQIDFMRYQAADIESSGGFASSSRNKRSVLLDLKGDRGRVVGQDLAAVADIIIENNTSGVMDRLGMGYDDVSGRNPGIVYLSSQAFGATGPGASFGGFGPTNQAVSGTSYMWNHPGVEMPEGVSCIHPDHILGRMGCMAIVAALDERERTGKGQHIDMAQAEVAMAMIAEAFIESELIGEAAPHRGNRSEIGAPHGVFPCLAEDSWIAITIENDQQWHSLVKVSGIEGFDDPELATLAGRMARRDEIEGLLIAYTTNVEAGPLMRRLQMAGVPAGALQAMPQVMADPHVIDRRFYQCIEHPVMGPTMFEGVPYHAEELSHAPLTPAPLMGQHTDEVLSQWIGLGTAEIDGLRNAGAFV